jgi:uncharacterized protein (TIGR00297 family)
VGYLQRTTKFGAADLVAVAAAGALVAVHCFRHAGTLSLRRVLLAIAVAATFAAVAWIAHGVSWSGALAGSGIAFIFVSTDLRIFWELLVVFLVTFAATQFGRRRKQEMQLAEGSSGRSASQVMANLGVAGLIVAIAPQSWPLPALAALAEAAADTSSSEVGTALPGKTVLLTSWKPVAPGVDGGVSMTGTFTGLIAAAIVALAAVLLKLTSSQYAFAVIFAGFLGSLIDSFLGAMFERRGLLNNDLVNLLSTAAAVLLVTAVTY